MIADDQNRERETETAMAALLTSAPPNFASDVLVEVGLADRYARMDSPIGPLTVVWNGVGVASVETVDVPDDAEYEAAHLAATGRRIFRADALPRRLASAIQRRLDGDRHIRIDLDLRGRTAFERDVWSKALEIPRGEVRPYGWIAAEIGRPKAVRAVGTALGHNPVPLIVPCHRVVRSDGLLGQYSLGGPGNKRTILAAEGVDVPGLERLAAAGIRYIGSDTTKIFCLPTCRHARRVTDRHRLEFHSLGEVAARGYRACRVCRPAAGYAAA
jgi:O-6-methylguanine DNA methyltransferase